MLGRLLQRAAKRDRFWSLRSLQGRGGKLRVLTSRLWNCFELRKHFGGRSNLLWLTLIIGACHSGVHGVERRTQPGTVPDRGEAPELVAPARERPPVVPPQEPNPRQPEGESDVQPSPVSPVEIQKNQTGDFLVFRDSDNSLIKSRIDLGSEGKYGIDFCKLVGQEKYYLAEPGRLVSEGYVKVRLANPIAGCALANQDVFVAVPSISSHSEFDFKKFENPAFESKISEILTRGQDRDTKWSVEIRGFGPNGERLNIYSKRAREVLRPASTLKIFTTFAALKLIPGAEKLGSPIFYELRDMMKVSDNDVAQKTFERIGGAAAVLQSLRASGIQTADGFKMLDGSGLRYDNRVSAHDLINVLTAIRGSSQIKAFRALLPVAGVDGTLASRLSSVEGRVAAKTGTLISDPAAALAGFGDAPNGWQIVFGILGDSMDSVDAGRQVIDEVLVKTLDAVGALPREASGLSLYATR